jgi:hypothetical protein
MGVVIPFPRKSGPKLPMEELDLLNRLRDSFEVTWHDGWAIPGVPHGVDLLKGGRIIGTWSHDETGFSFWAVGNGAPTAQVWTLHAAHEHSLLLLMSTDSSPTIA